MLNIMGKVQAKIEQSVKVQKSSCPSRSLAGSLEWNANICTSGQKAQHSREPPASIMPTAVGAEPCNLLSLSVVPQCCMQHVLTCLLKWVQNGMA